MKRADLLLLAMPLLIAGLVDILWLRESVTLVVVSPRRIDVGRVPASEPLRLSAMITNAGRDTVRLGQPRMECGAIDAVLGSHVLEPNASTQIDFTLVPSPFGRQERTIVFVNGYGRLLDELAVVCEVDPSLVAVPTVLQAPWTPDGIRASFTVLESDSAVDGSLSPEDLDIEVEGELRLARQPELAATLGARIRTELMLVPSDPRLFGALEARVRFRHANRPGLTGSARLLTERPIPGAEVDWPNCFQSIGVDGATFRFPLSVRPGAMDPMVGPRWEPTATAWVVQVPRREHGDPSQDVRPIDLNVEQGVIRLRLAPEP